MSLLFCHYSHLFICTVIHIHHICVVCLLFPFVSWCVSQLWSALTPSLLLIIFIIAIIIIMHRVVIFIIRSVWELLPLQVRLNITRHDNISFIRLMWYCDIYIILWGNRQYVCCCWLMSHINRIHSHSLKYTKLLHLDFQTLFSHCWSKGS